MCPNCGHPTDEVILDGDYDSEVSRYFDFPNNFPSATQGTTTYLYLYSAPSIKKRMRSASSSKSKTTLKQNLADLYFRRALELSKDPELRLDAMELLRRVLEIQPDNREAAIKYSWCSLMSEYFEVFS